MKQLKTKILLFSGLLLILFNFSSCESGDDNSINSVDAKIVKEILIMGLQLLDDGTIATIQSQEGLNNLFNDDISKIPVELKNINFEQYTLILGTKCIGQGLYNLSHNFECKENNHYDYTITIMCNDFAEAPTFTFGVLVDKLPNNSNVVLHIKDNLDK